MVEMVHLTSVDDEMKSAERKTGPPTQTEEKATQTARNAGTPTAKPRVKQSIENAIRHHEAAIKAEEERLKKHEEHIRMRVGASPTETDKTALQAKIKEMQQRLAVFMVYCVQNERHKIEVVLGQKIAQERAKMDRDVLEVYMEATRVVLENGFVILELLFANEFSTCL
ncbi:hypothetical protein ON010_g15924 [Phytophthora cinnamomi]|nr:hypothetical protein ON010_g15924 [Phytophthora cinnamomi]